MQGLTQCIKHVICMVREMRVALNQAFVHGKQSGIIKWNTLVVCMPRLLALALALVLVPPLIRSVPVLTKTWHGVACV